MPYRVYAATKKLGVFYSSDFELDSSNPTWTAINTGLPNGNILQFMVDYVDPDNTQYVIHSDGNDVYRRRNNGNWELILTSIAARAVAGDDNGLIFWITSDEENSGILYALFVETTVDYTINAYILRSIDYGDTWSLFYTQSGALSIYGVGNIIARGDTIWFSFTWGGGAQRRIYHVINGIFEAVYNNGIGGAACYVHWMNNTDKDTILASGWVGGPSPRIFKLDSAAGVITPTELAEVWGISEGTMWYDFNDASHFRAGDGTAAQLFRTNDAWTTEQSVVFGASEDVILVISAPDNMDIPVIGISASGGVGINKHPIILLESESSAISVGKSGANWNTPPYSNSIPVCNVSNGIAHLGIFFFPAEANIYVHAVEGIPDTAVEEPLWGDRSAFDELNYPQRHSEGIRTDTYIHHVPRGINIGDILQWDGTEWSPIDGTSVGGEFLLDDDGNILLDDDMNILIDG